MKCTERLNSFQNDRFKSKICILRLIMGELSPLVVIIVSVIMLHLFNSFFFRDFPAVFPGISVLLSALKVIAAFTFSAPHRNRTHPGYS